MENGYDTFGLGDSHPMDLMLLSYAILHSVHCIIQYGIALYNNIIYMDFTVGLWVETLSDVNRYINVHQMEMRRRSL